MRRANRVAQVNSAPPNPPRVLTNNEVKKLVNRVIEDLHKETKPNQEEPGLTEEARNVVHQF
jgi:hypothetical protein